MMPNHLATKFLSNGAPRWRFAPSATALLGMRLSSTVAAGTSAASWKSSGRRRSTGRSAAMSCALYNHDAGAVLGRTPKTLQLRKDARGLAFDLDPAPTQAGREALELVRRGDSRAPASGSRRRRTPGRGTAASRSASCSTSRFAEISLTAFPCYAATDVSVAQRALTAWQSGVTHPVKKPVDCLAAAAGEVLR